MNWRTIQEPGESVRVLRGILVTRPAVYDQRRFSGGIRETLHGVASFSFSALVHVLVLALLVEFFCLAIPKEEETVMLVALHRERAQPAPSEEKMPCLEPVVEASPVEASRAAEEPEPAEVTPPVPGVVGAGSAGVVPKPEIAGIREGLHEIPGRDVGEGMGTGYRAHRGKKGRTVEVGRHGGNVATEAAVESGLRWLVEHQMPDGRWSAATYTSLCPKRRSCGGLGRPEYDHGLTGLVLLGFLGAGYTHQEGVHRETVVKAIAWLRRQQGEEGYFFDPLRLKGGNSGEMYGNGVCAFALGEALAMTRDEELRPMVERAVAGIVAAQKRNGGWYYSISASPNSEFTLSVWQMMGLRAAMETGVPVPPEALKRAQGFVRSSTTAGGGVYYSGHSHVTAGSTAAGLFARCMFRMSSPETIERGLRFLDAHEEKTGNSPGAPEGEVDLYTWYYRSLVEFQVQGRRWRDWNRRIRPFLVSTQRTGGHAAGSWYRSDYMRTGAIYPTAMGVLILETYYRYPSLRGNPSPDDLIAGSTDVPLSGSEAARVARLKETPERRRERLLEESLERVRKDRPEERFLGARRLAELGEESTLPALIEAAERAEGPLKAAHLRFVGKLKSAASVSYLMRYVDHPDADVRGAAMEALARVTGARFRDPEGWKEWYAARGKP